MVYTFVSHLRFRESFRSGTKRRKEGKGESCGGYKGKVGRGVVRVGVMAGILRKTDPLSL